MQVSLLGPGDCRRLESTVVALRDRWRNPELGLATLGSPVYRNGESLERYFSHAAEDNPMLRAHFWWAYARVFTALECLLPVPLSLLPSLALPGFHILDTSRGFDGGGFHRDGGHLALGLGSRLEVADNVSFTLPVRLPCAAGVDIAISPASGAAGPNAVPESRRFAFRTGDLHLFSGDRLHQIAPCPPAPGLRLTLQGHVVPLGHRAVVFW